MIAWSVQKDMRDGPGYAKQKTRDVLKQVCIASCLYHDDIGSWPSTTSDFTNNHNRTYLEISQGTIRDGWRRPILYKPYEGPVGFGSVISLGSDGKPGGTGLAKDIEYRFSEKDSWEHQPSDAPRQ